MLDVSIYIEGKSIEQFKDENISIKSSVKDINDISKVFTDFSKSFTVPASKENNRLFKHWYNADITGGFDARTSKDATIEINELPFTKGKISLEKVSIENGNISNYAIRFTGETTKINKVLGDDKLSDLDFTDLNHNFDSATVEQGATSSLFNGELIYPLISVKRRMFYDSLNTVVTNELQTNIKYTAGRPNDSIRRKDLKPAVKVSDVLSRVLNTYPDINIQGDIFTRNYFTEMYMWLNKDEGDLKANGTDVNTLVDWTSGNSTYTDFVTDITTFTQEPNTLSSRFNLIFTVFIGVQYSTVSYNAVIKKDGVEVYRSNDVTGDTSHGLNTIVEDEGYTFHIESSDALVGQFRLLWQRRDTIDNNPDNNIFTAGVTEGAPFLIPSVVDVGSQMPDMKIIDFIMGIVKMFNLVIIPTESGALEFITMREWYAQGGVWDISKYIDRDKVSVGRGKLVNTFNFNYSKPQTLLNKQFLSNNTVAYGDLEAKLYDNNGVLLDGGAVTIKLPFENMLYERINDLSNGINTELQYGFAVDDKLEPTSTKLVMFYNTNIDVSSEQLGWLEDTNDANHSINTINLPNNTISLTDNTTQSINFGSEFSTYNYGEMEQTLYKSFYEDYISDMFSVKRRQYNYEGYFPIKILNDLKLNDRLVIDNYRYIINGIDKQITTGFVKLDLLNDIYKEGELLGDELTLSRNSLDVSNDSNQIQISVNAKGITTAEILDIGSGIFVENASFPTVTNIGTFTFNIQSNETAYSRTQLIRFTNGSSYSDYVLTQDGAIDLFNITVDTTLLTVDTTNFTI